jgi:hypothetical protein
VGKVGVINGVLTVGTKITNIQPEITKENLELFLCLKSAVIRPNRDRTHFDGILPGLFSNELYL